MGSFFLKSTLVEPKTVAGVSSSETEGPWKVWWKNYYWFPTQLKKKSLHFVPASHKVEISNFTVSVFLKGTLVESKAVVGVSSYETEVSWQVWGKTDSWFPIQPRKQFSSSKPEDRNFKFHRMVFLKGTLVEPKTVAQV